MPIKTLSDNALYFSEFNLFAWRALSGQPTPYQALAISLRVYIPSKVHLNKFIFQGEEIRGYNYIEVLKYLLALRVLLEDL